MISGVSYGNEKDCPLNKLIMSSPDGSKVFTVQRYAKKSVLRCFKYKSKKQKISSESNEMYYEYKGKSDYQEIIHDYNFPSTTLDKDNFACQTVAQDEVFEGLLGTELVYIYEEVNTSASPTIYTTSYSKTDFEKRGLKNLVWATEQDLLGTELEFGDKLHVHFWTTDEGAGPLGTGMYSVTGCRG